MGINKNWRQNPKWLAIRKITLDDCINARNTVERGEPLSKKPNETTNKNNFGAKNGLVGFGKFKHLTYRELREQQPNYWMWACNEIDGFQEKAEKFLT